MFIRVESVNPPALSWQQWIRWRWRQNRTILIHALGFLPYSYLLSQCSDIQHMAHEFLRLFLTLTSLNALVILFFVSQSANNNCSTPKTKEKLNERKKILTTYWLVEYLSDGTHMLSRATLWQCAPPLVSRYWDSTAGKNTAQTKM